MKKYLFYFMIASILVIASCGGSTTPSAIPATDEAIPVNVMELRKSFSRNNIQTSGTFTTDDETQLAFKTGGIISKIYVKEGDKISRGQLLASLDMTEIATQVQQARLAVDKSARDYKRTLNLYNDSVATLEQLQNAQTGKAIAEQQLTAAKFNLAFSEIRATSDGVVLRKLANTGQVIGPGVPVIQTSSKGKADWLLKVSVSDKDWSVITAGDSATVNTDAFEGQLMGVVSSKSENADPMTGSFSIEIKLDNARELNLASGMFGKATIYTSRRKSAWVIPYEALLDGNGSSGYVFVTNDLKKVSRVPVSISTINKSSVVISSGLEKYRYLVTSGSAYLNDQSIIKATTR